MLTFQLLTDAVFREVRRLYTEIVYGLDRLIRLYSQLIIEVFNNNVHHECFQSSYQSARSSSLSMDEVGVNRIGQSKLYFGDALLIMSATH